MVNPKGEAAQERLLDSVAKSPLFKLPPEIRTAIHRFALVADRNLVITKSHGIPEAALLSVSKFVRSETYVLFYRENVFTCAIYDYDCAPLVLECRKAFGRLQFSNINLHKNMVGNIETRGQGRNWKNLVKWYHLCHQKVCCGLGPSPTDTDEFALVAGLFITIVNGPSITTSVLDFLLKSLRPASVKLHPDWAED